MKSILLGAAAAAALVSAPAWAQEGPYIKGMVGYGWTSDLDVNVRDDEEFDVEAEGDLRYLLGAGYRFGNGWRSDVDVVYRENDLGSVTGAPGATSFEGYTVMLNGAYDFNRDGFVQPYLGAGVGFNQTEVTVADGVFRGTSDEQRTAGQVFAGLGFDVTERISATVEYRYMRLINDIDVLVGSDEFRFRDPDSQDIFLGLTFNFNKPGASSSDEPPAPPALAAAGGPLDLVCDDLPFVVYFGWDETEVSQTALRVIEQAANQAKECEITRVTVVGHADTSGNEQYNVGLSERRARIVRDELIRQGVAASLIVVEGAGEGQPAVATGDGVRERLNRRAEATILVIK